MQKIFNQIYCSRCRNRQKQKTTSTIHRRMFFLPYLRSLIQATALIRTHRLRRRHPTIRAAIFYLNKINNSTLAADYINLSPAAPEITLQNLITLRLQKSRRPVLGLLPQLRAQSAHTTPLYSSRQPLMFTLSASMPSTANICSVALSPPIISNCWKGPRAPLEHQSRLPNVT